MKAIARTVLLSIVILHGGQSHAADAKPSAKPTAPVEKSKDKPAGKAANDQLILDATTVTGNRELPKVMYIVPWKKAELGNLPGQPFNTLLDEALAPVDREVFRREVAYYQVIADKDRASVKASNADTGNGDVNRAQPATPGTDRK